MSKWEDAMDQDALDQEQERLDRRIRNRLFYEQEAIAEIDADAKAHPAETAADNVPPEREKLKRDIRAEALARLEDAARTPDDFQKIVEWWDRLDANRERKERYHEVSRSGDELPLDHGASPDELFFPDYLNNVLLHQIQKGDFLDAIFNCPYEIHELVTEEYLSEILLELPEDSKELLFLWAIRLYSTVRIASIRGVTDRNIRRVRNTLLKRIQKKLLAALLEKERKQQDMTMQEKEFLADNRAKVDRGKKR